LKKLTPGRATERPQKDLDATGWPLPKEIGTTERECSRNSRIQQKLTKTAEAHEYGRSPQQQAEAPNSEQKLTNTAEAPKSERKPQQRAEAPNQRSSLSWFLAAGIQFGVIRERQFGRKFNVGDSGGRPIRPLMRLSGSFRWSSQEASNGALRKTFVRLFGGR